MADKNSEFLKRLLVTFQIEAEEHLAVLSSGLLDLEKAPAGEQRSAIVEKIFREVHSLKGAARAVNRADVETICQSLESVFSELKRGRALVSPALLDLTHDATESLRSTLASASPAKPGFAALIQRLDDASRAAIAAPAEPSPAPALAPQEALPSAAPSDAEPVALTLDSRAPRTIRIQTTKLDAVMRQTEELLAPRQAVGQLLLELREVGAAVAARTKQRAGFQSARRSFEGSLARPETTNGGAKSHGEAAKLLEYLETEEPWLKAITGRIAQAERSTEHHSRALAGMVDSLLRDVKELHTLPFSSLLDALPRQARELARDQGKQVELATSGGEIEIDRRILEEMKDPLVHLIRNCVDHGIEKPEAREQKGKPRHGAITVAVSHQDSSKVEIVVADDGTGVDVAAVVASAERLGLRSAGEIAEPAERRSLALIFQSGLSTSPIITDLSGRGLGLAIVREKVDRLGGAIAVETRPDAGTTVRIELPLTLATFRGLLVRTGDRLFVVPALSVERVARVDAAGIRTVENRETIPLDGKVFSLVWLSDVLELPRAAGEGTRGAQAVVLALGGDRIAFRVDAVVAEQEVLVKGLGRQLARVRNVSGASMLGTGAVVPVLNVPDLMRSATRVGAPQEARAAAPAPGKIRRSILVVEDSITSRALLKNILQAGGYNVTTAIDGIDAHTTLKSGTFDLVVSDVEMPRMDGFDLTAKIRADPRLAELPVVLVTALESREHRERGIDAGANAYIVKSSFDQSNLLDVVRRLL